MAPLLECAGPGEPWLADRNFYTSTILLGWHQAQASFIVREHGRNGRALASSGPWVDAERIETGQVREQRIDLKSGLQGWRRIELQLDQPTDAGDTVIRLWSNLPAAVGAHEIARLYRKRWRIEGMFDSLSYCTPSYVIEYPGSVDQDRVSMDFSRPLRPYTRRGRLVVWSMEHCGRLGLLSGVSGESGAERHAVRP